MRACLTCLLVGCITASAVAQSRLPTTQPTRERRRPQITTTQPAHPPAAERAAARLRQVDEAPMAKKRQRTTRQLLATRIGEIHFEATPLEQVFAALGELVDVNIIVRWQRLEDVGIARDVPVSLQLRELSLRSVLLLVMQQATGGDTVLAYRASPRLILITTREEFDRAFVVRIYDVKDLVTPEIEHPWMFIGSTREFVTSVEPVVGQGAAAVRPITEEWWGGTGAWFGGQRGYEDANYRPPRGKTKEELLRELVEVIQQTVEPDHWEVNGGRGTIAILGDQLVIRASPLVHQKIGGPLRR